MLSKHSQRIAIIAPSAPPLGSGGVASAHFHLFRCLGKQGYDVRLFTFGDSETISGEEGIERFGTTERTRRWIRLALFIFLKLKGSRKLAYQLADIAYSAPGVFKLNRRLKIFSPDLVIMPDQGAPGLLIEQQSHARLILVSHHNPARFADNPLIGDFCPLDASIAVSIGKKVLKKVAGVICPSEYMRESLIATYDYKGRVEVVPNILDEELLDSIPSCNLQKHLGLPEGAPVVYIPSAGSRIKGSRFVFEIIRRLAAAYGKELGFYLSGSINEELQEELCYLPGNVRIFRPEHVSYQQNITFVKGCSFCISPTLLENFGMALIEANYCAVPVVTFDTGGNREIIDDGENGFLVPFLDVEALLREAARFFDDRFLCQMQEITVKNVRRRFNQEKITGQILRFAGVE